METAVIDRFEGNFAVLLIGPEERKMNVSREQLPHEAKEGDWLNIETEGDKIVRAEVDVAETKYRKKHIQSMLEKLRHKGGSTLL